MPKVNDVDWCDVVARHEWDDTVWRNARMVDFALRYLRDPSKVAITFGVGFNEARGLLRDRGLCS